MDPKLVNRELDVDIIELQNDCNYENTLESNLNLKEFWCKKTIAYPKLRKIPITIFNHIFENLFARQ